MRIKEDLRRIFRRGRRFRALGAALSISGLNQALGSGTNFVLGLYLVRNLTSAEFGLFGIGFAVCLFYAGIGNALFLTQMVVHAQDRPQGDRLHYVTGMFALVCLFCGMTAIVGALIVGFAWLGFESFRTYASLCLGIVAASLAFLLKDFFVRHSYNCRKEADALRLNVVTALTMVTALLSLRALSFDLTAASGLLIFALANTTAALAGALRANLPMRAVRICQLRLLFSQAWLHGKWAIAQNFVYWMRTQAHTYIAAMAAGPAAVGLLNAARLLVAPLQFLMPAISLVVLPRFVELRVDQQRLARYAIYVSACLLAIALLYSVSMLLNFDEVLRTVLGNQYAYPEMLSLASAWCAIVCVQMMLLGVGSLGQAIKEFRRLALASSISAVVAIACASLLLPSFGLAGTLIGVLIGESVHLVLISKWTLGAVSRLSDSKKNKVQLLEKQTAKANIELRSQ